MLTLRIWIIAHTRQFILGKKFSLYHLIWDLCVYRKLRFSKHSKCILWILLFLCFLGITFSRKIPKLIKIIHLAEKYSSNYLKFVKEFDAMLQSGPTPEKRLFISRIHYYDNKTELFWFLLSSFFSLKIV